MKGFDSWLLLLAANVWEILPKVMDLNLFDFFLNTVQVTYPMMLCCTVDNANHL